ncbi:MAG TPA: proline--tRNA ligase [Chloroflexia bacterium]|nr:proline--tRNA ligase [Chloroflexia bacterium]
MSSLFSQTLREAPSDVEVASHRLLLRAGFIRQLATGIFSYLPLAKRSIAKIESIMREEINRIGGQEITMPVVHPGDIWKETGRWYKIGSELGRFLDKSGRDMALAMTHEEVVADLVRKEIRSYRQLPQLIYHLQTKWRDDPRPRAGLIRVREFTMLDSYSLDPDEESLDTQYRAHYQAYFNIFNRCALPVMAVKADVGMMGGSLAHEFMYLTPVGEDTLVLCGHCGYSANRQVATFQKPPAPAEEPLEMEKVPTPNVTTIDALAEFLSIPKSKTAKAVFLVATIIEGEQDVDKFVFAVVRGDMDVNETKLSNAVGAKSLRPAHEEEIKGIGAEPGYGSPVGVRGAIIVVDDAVASSPNLVAGANEVGYHLLNVNYGRDYTADVVCDIAAAQEGDACSNCGNPLRLSRGVEVGNIFKLGTFYSDALGCRFLDKEGKSQPVIMGSYGIGVGRLLACIAEEHHDERGLLWPITVAPHEVHMVVLAGDGSEAKRVAEDIYATLVNREVEVLYDDRDETPGVKFADADLIGIPLRLTISARSLQRGGIELKRRASKDSSIASIDELEEKLNREVWSLHQEITGRVVEVKYDVEEA